VSIVGALAQRRSAAQRRTWRKILAFACAVAVGSAALATIPSSTHAAGSLPNQPSPAYPTPQAPISTPADHRPTPPPGPTGASPPAETAGPAEGWSSFSHWKRNGDGSITRELYGAPAFRVDGGTWKPTDPSIATTDSPRHPVAANGAVRPIQFGNSASDIVEVGLDGGPLTVSSPDLTISAPAKVDNGVAYSNVAPATDLRYRVGRAGLKEELVLRSADAPQSFRFHLADPKGQLGGLSKSGDGSYRAGQLIDGDVALTLTAPVAYEQGSNEHDPSSAHLVLTKSGDGFDVTVSLDAKWLAGKQFPIVLDPTMVFNEGNASALEGTAWRNLSGTCGGCNAINTTGDSLSTGSYTQGTTDMEPARAFVRMDLSAIPRGSVVSSANFGAYLGDCTGTYFSQGQLIGTYHCDTHSYNVELHQVNGAWSASSTYDQLLPLTDSAVLVSNAFPAFQTPVEYAPNRYTWDLTSEVQKWVNGTVANNGFAMKVTNEPVSIGDAYYNIGGPAFESGSNGWGFHPALTVTYTPPPTGPVSVSASSGNGSATVTWAPPPDNGGSAPTGYTVTTYNQSGTQLGQTTACATCLSTTIGSLTNGSVYSFSVAATNAAGAGPATYSNLVAVGAQPAISVTPSHDVGANNGPFYRGQTLTYNVTVSNPQSTSISGVTLSDIMPSGVLPLGTAFSAALNSLPMTACTTTTSPACRLTSPSTISITNFPTLAPNDTVHIAYQAVVVGADRGCATVATVPGAGSGANGSQVTVPITVCDTGIGLERWWAYFDQTVGPQSQVHVNAANGNLVLQATDATPVQGHGHLSYVLRRTYNSQDSTAVNLPGSLGAGWTLNIGQADDLVGDGVGADALYVPPAETVATPLAVTLIDRDGTRHVFQAKGFPPGFSSMIDVTALQGLTNPGAVGALIPKVLQVLQNGHRLCVDQTYSAPPGVHIGLWRYLDVTTTSSSCAPAAGTTPAVLGFAAERPDRLRYEFSANGTLLDMLDANGVELRYDHEFAPVPGVNPGRLTNVYETRSSCPTGPSPTSTCRALRFNYTVSPIAGQPACTPDTAGVATTCATDPGGRVTRYVTDSQSRLIKVDNPDGFASSYSYGSCGGSAPSLCSVTDPRGGSSAFTYTTPTVGVPQLATLKDRRNVTTTITYAGPNYVSFDTAGLGRFTQDTPSRRHRYSLIDATGRVGEIDEGDTGDNYLREATYTWDGPGATCRQPDNAVDNNLCRLVRHALSKFSADEDRRYVYGAEGQLLAQDRVTTPEDVKTTYGYHAQYVEPPGTAPILYDDHVAGFGNVTSDGPSGGRGDSRTLFAISDRTQSLTPRGNHAGATIGTYLTTYKVDNLSTANPNAAPAANTCTNPSSPSANTGNVCETDEPSFDGTNATVTRSTYDPYGQRITKTTPKAVAEGGGNYTYTYYIDPPSCSADPQDCDLSASVSAGGWLKGVSDPTGAFVAFAYDHAGNVARTWDRDATKGLALSAFPGTLATPPSNAYHETLFGPYANAPAGSTAYSAPWRYLLSDRDPLANLATYTVDPNGNQTTIRPPRGNAASSSAYDVTQGFDAFDNLTSTLLPAEKAANQPDNTDHPTTYGYDAYNKPTSMTDPRGNVTAYRYDRVGRIAETDVTRGSAGGSMPAACKSPTTSSDAPVPLNKIECSMPLGHDGVDNVVGTQDGNHQISYMTYDGVHRQLAKTVPRFDGTYTNLATQTLYDPDGHATDVCSPRDAAPTSLEPDASATCTASSKLATHTAYDSAGRPSTVTTYRDANTAELVTYRYDADGNQISVTDANLHRTTRVYDLLDRKVSEAVPRDATHTNTTAWAYDPAGNVTAITRPGTPASRITAYGYDADNRLTDTIVGSDNPVVALAGTVDAQGSKNVHTRVAYDADGDVVARFDPRAFDPAETPTPPDPAFIMRTDYDADRRPSASYVPRYDSAATGRHDDLGLTDPSGTNQQTTQCPANPSPAPQTVAGVPAYPSTVGVCVTRVTYDATGNRSRVTLPTATGGSSNRYTDYVYTDDNLLAAECDPTPSGGSNLNASSCAPANSSTRSTGMSYLYDADGRTVSATNALGNWTQTSYYADETVKDETQIPNGSVTHVTHHTYDANGHEKTLTDPVGNVTTTNYFDDDRKKDVTDGGGDKTSYTLDGVGNPLNVTSPSANAGDANNTSRTPTTNTYTFDNLLLTSTVPVSPDGTQRRRTTYGYDPGGRKLTQQSQKVDASGNQLADGGTLSFEWFQDDRMSVQTGRDNVATITTAYDPAGNKTSITDSTGGGSTITANYYLDDLPRNVGDGTRTTRSSYDGSGTRYQRRDDTSSTNYPTQYGINDAGLVTSMKATALTGTSGTTTTFTYDGSGRPAVRTDQNNIATTHTFAPDDTLTQLTVATSGSSPYETWSYAYDKDKRVTAQTYGGWPVNHPYVSEVSSYAYDGAGHLRSFQAGTDPARTVTWDHDGNRLSYPYKDASGASYTATQTYNADDSVATRTDQFGGPFARTYAPWGGLTNDTCSSFAYDPFDRQASVSVCAGGIPTLTHTYDGLDRQRTADLGDGNGPTTVHYDGLSSSVAMETTNAGVDTVNELDAGGAPIARAVKSASHPPVEVMNDDGTGNVTVLTTSALECTARFDPFGTPLKTDTHGEINSSTQACNSGDTGNGGATSTNTARNDIWFRGGRRQMNTGQYQFGSRTYDPNRASFLTPDSYRADDSSKDLSIGTDPLTRNTYGYVNGDPVNLIDPDGHWALPIGNWMRGIVTAARGALQQINMQQHTKRIGACTANLDCSIADFDSMSISERQQWLATFENTWAPKYQAQGWFNAVGGILHFFKDKALVNSGNWWSVVDSGILQGMQDGMALAEGKNDPNPQNAGGQRWLAFFRQRLTARAGDLKAVELSKRLWGTAEQTSTNYGLTQAGQAGLPETGLEKAFINLGNLYRASLGQEVREHSLNLLGRVLCFAGDCRHSAIKSNGSSFGDYVLDPRGGRVAYVGASAIYDEFGP
jgi:RHS repeat-associated protein/uncharacterized repeat protein (TIGR01451 family)